MLFVHVRAGVSKIHGIGLIAQERIPAGTRVWVFQPGFDVVLSADQLAGLAEPARTQALHYTWYDKEHGGYILAGDDDRFTNHSDDPNTRWDGKFTFAVRDIQAGEEVTFDYRELDGTDHVGWEQAARNRVAT